MVQKFKLNCRVELSLMSVKFTNNRCTPITDSLVYHIRFLSERHGGDGVNYTDFNL